VHDGAVAVGEGLLGVVEILQAIQKMTHAASTRLPRRRQRWRSLMEPVYAAGQSRDIGKKVIGGGDKD
jgi:hypothetical protein